MERTVQQLSATPSTKVTGANLELQAKCSEQGAKVFADLGYATKDALYYTHYNSQINKCFIDIRYTESNWFYRDFLDAFERKQYGIMWQGENEHKPGTCNVRLTSGQWRRCQSSDEFNEVVNTYMEDH